MTANSVPSARRPRHPVEQGAVSRLPAASCNRSALDPDAWFAPPGTPKHRAATQSCLCCPVLYACLRHAID